MYELDKQKFGAFVAQLRKERGYTQKELAQKLHLSDKAVSKWETGVSIPDTAMLLPLSQLLDVTVTELLLCRRQTSHEVMEPEAVEQILQSMLGYAGGRPERAWRQRSAWQLWYVLCLLSGGGLLTLGTLRGVVSPAVWTAALLGAVFGAYFCYFVPLRLPEIYDHTHMSAVHDGAFRMNLTGVSINNRNWPRICAVGRGWSCAVMVALPAGALGVGHFLSPGIQTLLTLVLVLGGLFVPLYAAGKIHQ